MRPPEGILEGQGNGTGIASPLPDPPGLLHHLHRCRCRELLPERGDAAPEGQSRWKTTGKRQKKCWVLALFYKYRDNSFLSLSQLSASGRGNDSSSANIPASPKEPAQPKPLAFP